MASPGGNAPYERCSAGSVSWAVGTREGVEHRRGPETHVNAWPQAEAGLKKAGTPSNQEASRPLPALDGMLYSGTMNNFLGSEPILIRTLGPQPVLKTDNFLRWLQRKDPSPQHRSGPSPSEHGDRPEHRCYSTAPSL